MSRTILPGVLQDGLNLSQAACYAAMAAKDHAVDSAHSQVMLSLSSRLAELSLQVLADEVSEPDLQAPHEPE